MYKTLFQVAILILFSLLFLTSCNDSSKEKTKVTDKITQPSLINNNSNCEQLNSKGIVDVELVNNFIYGLKTDNKDNYSVVKDGTKWKRIGRKGFLQIDAGGKPRLLYGLKDGEKTKGQFLVLSNNKWKRLKGKDFYDLAATQKSNQVYLLKDTKKQKGKVYRYDGEKLSSLRSYGFKDIEVNNHKLYALKDGKNKKGMLYHYEPKENKWKKLKGSQFEKLIDNGGSLYSYKNGTFYKLVNDKLVKSQEPEFLDSESNSNYSLTLQGTNTKKLELCKVK